MSKSRVALTLISEKVRFWTDEQYGFGQTIYPPRLDDLGRTEELRKSLLEIDQHCKDALREKDDATLGKYDAKFHAFMELGRLFDVLFAEGHQFTKEQAEAVHACDVKLAIDLTNGDYK